MSPHRRDVLRAGGVAALLTSGLAGCVEELPAGSDETPPEYADWLFDTGALFEADMRGFYSVSVDAYRDQRAVLPAESREAVERLPGRYEGITLDDFDRVTGLGAVADHGEDERGDELLLTSVMTGSFDTAAVRAELTGDASLSAAGSHGGYDLFTGRRSYDPSRTRAAAVSEDAVVLAMAAARHRDTDGDRDSTPSATPAGGVTAERAVELHVDAKTGEADRLAPASAPLSDLAVTLDGAVTGGMTFDPGLVRGRTGIGTASASASGSDSAAGTPEDAETGAPTPSASTPTVSAGDSHPVPRHLAGTIRDLSAAGASADAGGEAGEVAVRLRYADRSAAETGAEAVRDLRSALRAEVDALTVPDVDVSVVEATVVVTITGDPTAFYEALGVDAEGPASSAPQVSFRFDRHEDGRVTVTHDGGDTVDDGGRLRLIYDSGGDRVERRWGPDGGSVRAGDSITTERPVTDTLRVVWQSTEDDRAATLGLFRPTGENRVDPPDVSFGYTRRADGTVRVTHDGGATIERDLVLEYDGGDPQRWTGDDGVIEAGDSITTREPLGADGSLEVVWLGEETAVIGRYDPGTTPTRTPTDRHTPTPDRVGTSEGTATASTSGD